MADLDDGSVIGHYGGPVTSPDTYFRFKMMWGGVYNKHSKRIPYRNNVRVR